MKNWLEVFVVDGLKLGLPVGNILTDGSSLGYDEGAALRLGVELGEALGSIDSDGTEVGGIEGDSQWLLQKRQ